ncbi:hypothetical protein HYQ45_013010 [Verticillium longisporum]|uniref:Uncharacterized protein n=1 Tax=Verticillium longisporum TaxID=100787 RepID=A0A8I2ZDG6_VERLO|nr:hypothetical protein HYQ45_013010 [Verticillium longisporum]
MFQALSVRLTIVHNGKLEGRRQRRPPAEHQSTMCCQRQLRQATQYDAEKTRQSFLAFSLPTCGQTAYTIRKFLIGSLFLSTSTN